MAAPTSRSVLFVCTGNAGRSQMAEALCRRAAEPGLRIASAGVSPWHALHPVAVRLLEEKAVPFDGQHPKHVQGFAGTAFDAVVTIGDRALQETPELPGNPRRIHWDLPDPAWAEGPAALETAFRESFAAIEQRMPPLLHLLRSAPSARDLHLAPGLSTCLTRPHPFEPARHLPLFAAAGFAAIELNCCGDDSDFTWTAPGAIDELRRAAQGTGVRIFSAHAPGAWVPDPDPRTRRRTLTRVRQFLDAAAELQAGMVVLHAGIGPCLAAGLPRQAAEALLEETLAELERHVLPMPCRIGWENEAAGLSATEHMGWMRRLNASAFGFVLDTGHANLCGDRDAYLQESGPRLIGLHLNDNDGKGDLHVFPGQGTAPWDGLAGRLVAQGYTGPLMLEVEDTSSRYADLPAALAAARASLTQLGDGRHTTP